ncbi:acylneuraminate cytidylyltransferase family protein [Prochlorococcus sp. MIT 1307]|uniref:acylneuraminate cytidylyltransferase family protein n=1 Tax=Prochlorococcus sp. MIT 1307 TaxID=3096219 RepID=UPI002A760094|nr:acylneuraminate cytidylyltransferase family protein [Prochlorococcus sp. MIT 1307]
MNVALIPARGGSKGIPKKNLQMVNGKSLLSRTIQAAKDSKSIDLVFVSSDSKEILELASKCGAIAIQRSDQLSLDTTSTEEVILNELSNIENHSGKIELLILLQCTSPFSTSNEIDLVVNTLEENFEYHDAAFAVSECHSFIWQYDHSKKRASGINHKSDLPRQRRQDLKIKQYLELGSVYVVFREALLKSKCRFGTRPLPVEVSSKNSYIEIDSLEDLKIANLIAKEK